MCQCAVSLRIAQCLPRPGQHTRIIAGDFQRHVFQATSVSSVVEITTLPAVEQSLESLCAPCLEGCLDALCYLGPGWKGVVEELFQILAQLKAEIAIGTAINLERL